MSVKSFLLVLSLVLKFGFLQAQPVKNHGALQVKGIQLCDKTGKPTVLRGMSYGWHNWWPRFYNENSVRWLYKDWNVSVVRAAMSIEPRGGYKQDPAGSIKKIKAVVD